jgi:hypothetical protein
MPDFTPGPLEVIAYTDEAPRVNYEIWTHPGTDEGDQTAIVFTRADANLYAAAPEMYDALKGAHAAIDMLYARLIAVEGLRFLPSKDPTWPKMVAVFEAIKKVDGDA